jgi:ribosomal-protein-alanine N-acetyltransferase
MTVLYTARLELRPITLPVVTAVLEGRGRANIEALVGAEMPWAWPGRALVEQVFHASLDAVRKDPDGRLWGDRFAITREAPPRVVGSVVFHGKPDTDGVCEIAYGIEDGNQRKGFGTEAVSASIAWALAQPECRVVEATTMAWHKGAVRLLEKIGMKPAGKRVREGIGEMLLYRCERPE